jgi:N,N'-diacetylbacillosaminyl-diphospho-undecaprenol alpha-1,3-N-acetylgalactosaminyltransferase
MIRKGIISEDKTIIIKSVGVDTEKFSMEQYSPQKISAIKEKNGWQDKIIVLMVARAIWDKGIREYYDAAKIIDEKFDNVIFVLAGGTDVGNHSCVDESFLRSGAVEWLGHRDDMADMMAVCDIFVLPSYREGLPATLMEATSMSKPIVTTDVVGCRDVVSDGHNGFLVPPKDENSLAEKIEKLIENPQKRKIMGENGRITATEIFDVKKVVAQYMALYEKYHKKSSNE